LAVTGALSATDTISTTKAVASAGNIVSIKNSTDTGGDNTRYAGVNFLVGSDDGTSSIRSYRTNSASNYETALAFLTNPSGATQTPTEKMRITSTGNVGIGTTSPASILHLKKDGSGNGVSTTFEVSTGTNINWRIGCQNNVSDGFEITPSTASGGLTFSTPVAKFTSTGLAVTGAISGTNRFVSNGGTAGGNGIFDAMFNGNTAQGLDVADSANASGATFCQFRNSASSVIGSITRVTTTNAIQVNLSSDSRLKHNVRDFTDSGSLIDGLRPVCFDWNGDETNDDLKNAIGFIAQETHASSPIFAHIGAVSVGDEDPETVTKQWQRSDSALIPILVAELKALRQRVAALESN